MYHKKKIKTKKNRKHKIVFLCHLRNGRREYEKLKIKFSFFKSSQVMTECSQLPASSLVPVKCKLTRMHGCGGVYGICKKFLNNRQLKNKE